MVGIFLTVANLNYVVTEGVATGQVPAIFIGTILTIEIITIFVDLANVEVACGVA